MKIEQLTQRKLEMENSLKQIEQSFHMVTGHLAEINYQISLLMNSEISDKTEESAVTMDDLPIE